MIYKEGGGGGVLLFSSAYNKKALKNVKVDVDVRKGFLNVHRKNPGRVDSLHHVRTNMSVSKGISWGIRVQNFRMGELVFFFQVCIFKKVMKILE